MDINIYLNKWLFIILNVFINDDIYILKKKYVAEKNM